MASAAVTSTPAARSKAEVLASPLRALRGLVHEGRRADATLKSASDISPSSGPPSALRAKSTATRNDAAA